MRSKQNEGEIMGLLCIYLVMPFLSYALTWWFRRHALAAKLLDVPNHRSSHSIPTPRGGGLSFIICFLMLVGILFYFLYIDRSVSYPLLGGGVLIAGLGFLDDRGHVPAKWRLLVHFFICSVSLFFLNGMPDIFFGSNVFIVLFFINVLTVIYMVWLLNLYNFMDGIDGVAAMEAVFACLSAALFYCLDGYFSATYLPLGLGVAVAGFLIWNYPPARIFMGDAGSGFLGFVLGILSIQSTKIDASFFWIWLILLGVFIVDTTVTLLYRCFNGERFYEAHCHHAYQHAVQYYGRHSTITLGILVINLCWLLPIAFLVNYKFLNGFFALIISYIPLILITFKFNAGSKAGFFKKNISIS